MGSFIGAAQFGSRRIGAAAAWLLLLAAAANAAPVSWTGAAGDNLWQSAGNWSPVGVPGAADDVTIDVPGTPTITLSSGARTIKSLVLNEALIVSGVSLTVTGTATVNAAIAITSNGEISGGAWDFTNGSVSCGGSVSNRISNMTLPGGFTATGGYLRINNVAWSGTFHVTGDGTSLLFDGNQTIAAGSLKFEQTANQTGYLLCYPSGTLTLAAGASIVGHNAWLGYNGFGTATTIVNNGAITSDTAGRDVNIQAVGMSGNGSINANPGNINFNANNGTWTGTGPVTINASTLTIGCSAKATALDNLTRTGGSIVLSGTLDNTGHNLVLNAARGGILISGGSISGGTLATSGGASLTCGGQVNNRLIGVDLGTDFALSSGYLRIANTTWTGTFTMTGNGTALLLDGNPVLNTGTIRFAQTNGQSGYLLCYPSGTVTLGPGAAIVGKNGTIGYTGFGTSTTLINNGTITSDSAGGDLFMQANALSGTGSLNANPGNITFITAANATWTSMGAVTVNASTLTLTGTTTAAALDNLTRNGGSIVLAGTLDNSGHTLLLNPARGPLTLSAGTITGGTINSSGGVGLTPTASTGNRLTNVTIGTDLNIASGYLRLNNTSWTTTLSISGDTTTLLFDGSQTIPSGTIRFASADGASSSLACFPSGTLTLAAGASITGKNGTIGYNGFGTSTTLINNGTITSDTSGRDLNLQATNLTNNGTIRALAGATFSRSPSTASSFVNNSTLKLDSGASFNLIAGPATLGATGTLEIDIAGAPTSPANFGKVTLGNGISPSLALGGTLKINNTAGYAPTCGLAWNIISAAQIAASTPLTGSFATLDFPYPGPGNLQRLVYAPKLTQFFLASAADFDGDGFITFEDFDAFVSAFENGEPIADFDGDGFLTFEDFDAFVFKFEGGC